MIEFINSMGSAMYVDESRADEYRAAGYKPAVSAHETEAKNVRNSRGRSKRIQKSDK